MEPGLTTWPVLVDFTDNEALNYQRKIDLDAYSSLVSAFRTRGDLTPEKKKILHDVQKVLG